MKQLTKWAAHPAKPAPVYDAILQLQMHLGDTDFISWMNQNSCYDWQADQFLKIKIGSRYEEGDVQRTGRNHAIKTSKRGQTKKQLGVCNLKLYWDENERDADGNLVQPLNEGHWQYTITAGDISVTQNEWYYDSHYFQNDNLFTGPVKMQGQRYDILTFGHSESYFQPFNSNALCAGIAMLFARAFSGDTAAQRAAQKLTPLDQNTPEQRAQLVHREARLPVAAYADEDTEEERTVATALLASEYMLRKDFCNNYVITFVYLMQPLREYATEYNFVDLYDAVDLIETYLLQDTTSTVLNESNYNFDNAVALAFDR